LRRAAAVILCALALAPAAAVSFAHAFLERAVPGAGEAVHTPPRTLALSFTMPIEGANVRVQVFDAAGALIASSADRDTVVRSATITMVLPWLAPGVYRVAWHVDMGQGHETEGDYRFTVLDSDP
jgi:hypothetical protein